MARVNRRDRSIAIKIVYYGPGMSGKTTNLLKLHGRFPTSQRGDLIRLDTETERTLFFDYFPVELGVLGGYRLKANFFTVPGQSFYNQTRRIVVGGCDGLVFVADSHPDREEANLFALQNLAENLEAHNTSLEKLPLVFQWNKRDVPGALKVKLLQKQLNPRGLPAIEAIATEGEGIWKTQRAIFTATMQSLRAQLKARS